MALRLIDAGHNAPYISNPSMHEAMTMTARPDPVTMSESAAKRVAFLVDAQGNPNLKLRLSVSGGGCSGFQYGFGFDEDVKDGDIVVERDGVTLLVDDMSLLYLIGSEVDYVEDIIGASFRVTNPNATAGCGCGSSFSI